MQLRKAFSLKNKSVASSFNPKYAMGDAGEPVMLYRLHIRYSPNYQDYKTVTSAF
jgi:hypothetical protein